MKIVTLSDGRYRISYYLGMTQRRIIGTDKKILQADAIKAIYEYKAHRILPNQSNPKITFAQFVSSEYIPNHVNLRIKNKVRELSFISKLSEFFGEMRLSEVSQKTIERWQGTLAQEIQVSGINRYLNTLRALFNKAVQWEFLIKSPAKYVKRLPRENKRERFLSLEEIARIHIAAPKGTRIRAFFDIAINTGMRRDNIVSMTPEWIKGGKVPSIRVPDIENKNDRSYSVPMNGVVQDIIMARMKVTPPGQPLLDTTNNRTEWDRLKKAAGITNCTVHDLRHTFASHMAMKGENLATIGRLLNHSDPKLTWRYAHLSPDQSQLAVMSLNFEQKDAKPVQDIVESPKPD